MQLLLDIGMATGPVMGYILQSRLIIKNQSVGTFSIHICLVLLIANILRLNFYIFQTYELALFFQSIFMISAQLILLHICCLYRQDAKQSLPENQQNSLDRFWRWKDFSPYWQHTLGFAICSFLVSIIMWLVDFKIFGEAIGLIALLTESMLMLPQILEIIRQKDVQGISYGLIGLNLFGDTYKTLYFFFKDQPFQFKLCGVIQLLFDAVTISQIVYSDSSKSLMT